MKLSFITRGLDVNEETLVHPEMVTLANDRFAALVEKKGKLYAETAYFMFMVRLHNTTEPKENEKRKIVMSNNVARFFGEALKALWPEEKDNRMHELMADVDAIGDEITDRFLELHAKGKQS